MSTMHGDDSPGLQVVGSVIAEVIGVSSPLLIIAETMFEVSGRL